VSSRGPREQSLTVARPSSAESLAETLREAAAAGQAVFPVGGGRAMHMGDPPDRDGIELHTSGLDRVLEHSQGDMVVSVEAGVGLEALQEELGRSNQFLPLDPHASPGHTIGGLLATGLTGPLRLRYGSPRDYLIGIRVALPDGKLASAGGRVVKNVSGYDLMKLHVGALGTLGVIVAASFKVFPKPMHDVTVGIACASVEEAWAASDRGLALAMAPAALEVMSTGQVMARFFGSHDAVRRMVDELGWPGADGSFWAGHASRAAASWVRVAVPPTRLRQVLAGASDWWASPGIGLANVSAAGADQVRALRAAAEAAGGSAVIMAGPDELRREVGTWGSSPATLPLMRRLRDAFDPGRSINPGRFVV
jgi:glycolate oxidase FAD binding subunit